MRIRTVSELVRDGYMLNFTKNFIIMEWQDYREEEVVNSRQIASEKDDEELYYTLNRMIDNIRKKKERREKRWRHVAINPMP